MILKLILAFRVRVPKRVNVIFVIIRFLMGSFFLFFSYSCVIGKTRSYPFFLRRVVEKHGTKVAFRDSNIFNVDELIFGQIKNNEIEKKNC